MSPTFQAASQTSMGRAVPLLSPTETPTSTHKDTSSTDCLVLSSQLGGSHQQQTPTLLSPSVGDLSVLIFVTVFIISLWGLRALVFNLLVFQSLIFVSYVEQLLTRYPQKPHALAFQVSNTVMMRKRKKIPPFQHPSFENLKAFNEN